MLNRLLNSFSINRPDYTLTKEQEAVIIHDIEIINFKRMKLFLFILLIVEIFFIIFSDIPSLINSTLNGIWSDRRYFIIHILLLIVSLVGISVINTLIKNDNGILKKIYRIITPGLTIIILVLVSLLNGLDQIKTGPSSSVFIANILICSAVIIIKFPINFFVYVIPFTTFIGGLFLFQKDSALLYSNVINGTIFFVAVIIISKAMYDHQYDQIFTNIILKKINLKLDYISSHDPLTGLSNRRSFEIQAKQNMEEINQNSEEAALVLIDIDHFKYINDTFGHPIGDMVLKEVSSILLENLKETDLVARWGGEEFILLLSSSSIKEAYEFCNKIRVAIEKKIMIFDEFKINITASFGVAKLAGNFSNSFNTSYKLADKALYQCKNRGRNQVIIGSSTKDDS